MAKSCPSCGYSPIGPFTDNCPICAESVRGGSGGSARSPNQSRSTAWIIVLLVVGLGVAAYYGLAKWRGGQADQGVVGDETVEDVRDVENQEQALERVKATIEASRRGRTVAVPATQLLQEFQNDPTAADQKYKGKCLEISGVVERVGSNQHMRFIILHAGDENAKIKIECFVAFFIPKDKTRIEQLGKGQTITLRGDYGGRVSHLQLWNCVLVE